MQRGSWGIQDGGWDFGRTPIEPLGFGCESEDVREGPSDIRMSQSLLAGEVSRLWKSRAEFGIDGSLFLPGAVKLRTRVN